MHLRFLFEFRYRDFYTIFRQRYEQQIFLKIFYLVKRGYEISVLMIDTYDEI